MDKKVIFFDVDGTLIDAHADVHTVPEDALKAMKRLQALGHKMIICSGRPKLMLGDYFLNLGFDGYVLANGAYVELDGKSVYENRMDESLTQDIVELLDSLGAEYMLETADNIYIRPGCTEIPKFFARSGIGDIFTYTDDMASLIPYTLKIEPNIMDDDIARFKDAAENFALIPCFDNHGTGNTFEIYSPSVSKATGMAELLKAMGVDQSQTIAFGDGVNDMEMIRYAHTGVAMANGVQALKDIADIVAPAVKDNGLYQTLKELFPEEFSI